ncbi:hypothetical protein [Orrella sp. 11846]|uniref:hypothetical protein n=1 Tax=Orrella sp. 11846 TaxID=3409913 RepID=UPI003B5B5687
MSLGLQCAGCMLHREVARSQHQQQIIHQQMMQAQEAFKQPRNQPDHQMVSKPWVTGKPVSLSSEVTLPEALRAQVRTTMIFKDKRASLQEIASRIAIASSIPVRVLPDALLPSHHFLPRLQHIDQDAQVSAQVQLPVMYGTYPLAKILDVMAAQYDVHWRYHNQAIEIFRTQAQVFDVRVLTLSAETEMSLGRAGSDEEKGFQSSARTTLALAKQPVLEAIQQRLEPFLTRAATVSAQSGSLTSIVIVDTPEALARVAAYLESVNRSMSQRVRLVFEEMTVTRKENQQQGFDWSLAFAQGLLSLDGGSTHKAAEGASFSLRVGDEAVRGSLAIRALADYANVHRHTIVPVVTMNRRPVTHAVRSTFTYVDQVQALPAQITDKGQAGSIPSGVAISQKRETTGSFLTLVPDVQDDGQILLSVAYDNTVALPLKALQFGSESNHFQVQQLTVSGSGTVQQVALRPGRPVLIAGFEERQEESDTTRLSPGAPKFLGGHDHLAQQQRTTLIFVTAQLEEGL